MALENYIWFISLLGKKWCKNSLAYGSMIISYLKKYFFYPIEIFPWVSHRLASIQIVRKSNKDELSQVWLRIGWRWKKESTSWKDYETSKILGWPEGLNLKRSSWSSNWPGVRLSRPGHPPRPRRHSRQDQGRGADGGDPWAGPPHLQTDQAEDGLQHHVHRQRLPTWGLVLLPLRGLMYIT